MTPPNSREGVARLPSQDRTPSGPTCSSNDYLLELPKECQEDPIGKVEVWLCCASKHGFQIDNHYAALEIVVDKNTVDSESLPGDHRFD